MKTSGKEVSIMISEQWHEFMKNSDYKKYQIKNNRNRPYLDTLQRNLMEKYQLRYFREHPVDEELNCSNQITIKIKQ